MGWQSSVGCIIVHLHRGGEDAVVISKNCGKRGRDDGWVQMYNQNKDEGEMKAWRGVNGARDAVCRKM
jgi:hypothetical protein